MYLSAKSLLVCMLSIYVHLLIQQNILLFCLTLVCFDIVMTQVHYTIGYHFWTSLTTQTKEMLCPSNQLPNVALRQLPVN